MEKENPSIQSIQTTYRSMQSVVQSDHAPSLQSMHSAQTSFEQTRAGSNRYTSPCMNLTDRNGASMQSLKNTFSDEYSPQNTLRMRKISHPYPIVPPPQPKLYSNSLSMKPSCLGSDPAGSRQLKTSASQPLSKIQKTPKSHTVTNPPSHQYRSSQQLAIQPQDFQAQGRTQSFSKTPSPPAQGSDI